jgi:tripartite ATP-independent transporter DctP family solute receptor
MSLKKILGIVLLVTITGFAMAGGGAAGNRKTIMRVGDTWSPSHPMARAIDNVFKTQIEAKSNGAITVEVYHAGTLGNEQTLWDSVRNGSIEVVVIGTPMNSEYRPMLISDWPFLYRDLQHAKKVWTSSFADDFNKEFDAKFPSTHLLGSGPNSARTFTSSKPLTSVADFRGQKFRMPQNPIHVGIATDLGASVQVIPLNELFNALQTGVVDGQDNGMVTVLSEKFSEVQKYLFETNHIIATMNIIINADFLKGLSADHQKIIRDAAKETAVWAWDEYIKSVDNDRRALQAAGMTVTACSASEQAQIIQAIQPTLNRLYTENDWARPLTDKVRAVQ